MSDDETTDSETADSPSTERDGASPNAHGSLGWKVLGEVSAQDTAGVLGHNKSTDPGAIGVYGISDSSYDDAPGVKAETVDTGPALVANATSGTGVAIRALSDEGSAIYAESDDNLAPAVNADNTVSTGIGNAVSADTESEEGEAIRSTARYTGTGETHGIFARSWSNADDNNRVYPSGVRGEATGDGATRGVEGEVSANEGVGVVGKNLKDVASYDNVAPDPMGVLGITDYDTSETGAGLPLGVFGYATATSGTTRGVLAKVESGDGQALEADNTEGGMAVKSNGRLVAEETIQGGESNPSEYVARVINNQGTSGNAGGLAVTFPNRASDTDGFTTHIAFRHGGTDSGSIEGNASGGVGYQTTGADYAEWLPRLDPESSIDAGDIVGLVGQAITRDTADADRVLVVTDRPAVMGNSPGTSPEDREAYETVAFTGQVPAKVRGPVSEGDLIVPSGEHDGTARAIAPAAWRPGTPIVGQAWESDDSEAVTKVTVAVGIDDPAAVVGPALEAQDERIEELEAENEALRDRLASLEDRVATVEGPGSGPVVGDD